MMAYEKVLNTINIINDLLSEFGNGTNGCPSTSEDTYNFIQRLDYLCIKLGDSLADLPVVASRRINYTLITDDSQDMITLFKILRNNLEHNDNLKDIDNRQQFFNKLFAGEPVELQLQTKTYTKTFVIPDLLEMKRLLLIDYEIYANLNQ